MTSDEILALEAELVLRGPLYVDQYLDALRSIIHHKGALPDQEEALMAQHRLRLQRLAATRS